MSFLDALFSGAKVLLKAVGSAGRELVREVLKEIDQSAFGRAATRVVSGVADHYFGRAQDLAEEEKDLAAKFQRDGRRTAADAQRLREIDAERGELKESLEARNAQDAANEFVARADEVAARELDDDELSANVGILSAKACPRCAGAMRIRQGALNTGTGRRNFYWQCTEANRIPCPTVTLNLDKERGSVIRPNDPDLDTPKQVRRDTWYRPDIIQTTHSRLRAHLGDADQQVVCPKHLLPMKLLPNRDKAGGLLLDSYEYTCLGVDADGRACSHSVPLRAMPQVSATLKRNEGEGIIRH